VSALERHWLRCVAATALAVIVVIASRAGAQPVKTYRIGVILVGTPEPLRQDLPDLGYVEGQNTVLEVRDTSGAPERLDEFATAIPIVTIHTPDPVQLGLVESLGHPGGNVTGVTSLSSEMSVKQ